MRGAVEFLLVDLGVGTISGGSNMPSFMRAVKRRTRGGVDLALLEVALLYGVEIGLVVVVVLDLG
jgi:hypothetical protein